MRWLREYISQAAAGFSEGFKKWVDLHRAGAGILLSCRQPSHCKDAFRSLQKGSYVVPFGVYPLLLEEEEEGADESVGIILDDSVVGN